MEGHLQRITLAIYQEYLRETNDHGTYTETNTLAKRSTKDGRKSVNESESGGENNDHLKDLLVGHFLFEVLKLDMQEYFVLVV